MCSHCGHYFILDEIVAKVEGYKRRVRKYFCRFCEEVLYRMKLNRKPPFGNTSVDPDKSRAEIDRLLQEFGAEGVQWTTDWKNARVNLKFVLEAEMEGVKKKFGIDITPPLFAAEHRTYNPLLGRHEKVFAPNWAQ